jgi:beta-N-acetylhexosaminidase
MTGKQGSAPRCMGTVRVFHALRTFPGRARLRTMLFSLTAPLLIFACTSGGTDGPAGGTDPQPANSYPYHAVDEDAVAGFMDRMSLEQKVAQMYLVGVSLLPWEQEETRSLIRDLEVGGVFLQPVTGVVAGAPEVTAEITNALQALALENEFPVPLFIACDQEGGIPQALSRITGGTDQPGNMGLGATFDPNSTYLSYGIMGAQLSALGINATFAPVLGLMPSPEEPSMYTRCFGQLAAHVTPHAAQAVRGLQEQLVMATPKHFPSHSTAPGDEHFMLPVNREDEQTVREHYLPPFIAAIQAGADMIMTTHAVFTAWEDGLPSTYSHRIFTELLRGELGYRGLIVTDDMNMGSVTLTEVEEHYDVLAILAGADVILDIGANGEPPFGVAPGNRRHAWDVRGRMDAVLAAVADGRIPEERINGSVGRILRMKHRYGLFSDPFTEVDQVPARVNTPEQVRLSAELHGKAITLLRNEEGLWPLDPGAAARIHVVCPAALLSVMYPGAAWPTIAESTLLDAVRAVQPSASGGLFDADPLPHQVSSQIRDAAASGADVLVIGTYNALYHEGQKELVQGLLALEIPAVLVAVGMPYDLLAFPDAATCLVTYSNRDLALETAARVLFGEIIPGGRLPVSLPGLYDVGWSALERDLSRGR